jgi:transcriptional regulator with XRE-family HTH domain
MTTEREVDARAFLTARRRGRALTFGELLRAIRVGEEETQAVFASRLRIPKQHLSDIENGRRGVSVERAAAWAKTLGYHAGQFVELAVQAQLQAAGFPFVVTVVGRRRAPGRSRAA